MPDMRKADLFCLEQTVGDMQIMLQDRIGPAAC